MDDSGCCEMDGILITGRRKTFG